MTELMVVESGTKILPTSVDYNQGELEPGQDMSVALNV